MLLCGGLGDSGVALERAENLILLKVNCRMVVDKLLVRSLLAVPRTVALHADEARLADLGEGSLVRRSKVQGFAISAVGFKQVRGSRTVLADHEAAG